LLQQPRYVDARFGRLQEGFSEDPLLTSRLGVAAVRGLQGDGGSGPGTPLPAGRVAALAKHFVAYGKAAGGQNVGATEVSERTLREVFLAPWRAMIGQAGLRGLMPSHQVLLQLCTTHTRY
jgi:beta-glucosidase